MPSRGRLVVLFVWLSLPLAAQEPSRRPTFARVVDAAGEPVAGAVVTFAGCVPHLGTRIGPHDEQRVASDERGRARARLQEGLCYVAWATLENEQVRLVSDVVGFFGAGALTELSCHDAGPARRLEVQGVEAWAAFGPLRLFAVTPMPGTETELELVDGAVSVPLLPEWRFEARTADGSPLWQCLDPQDRLQIPPPQRLAVRVVNGTGKPLPGARIEQRVGREARWQAERVMADDLTRRPDEIRRPLATVGEDGTAEVTLCADGDVLHDPSVRDVLLLASAPGFATAACGRFLDQFYVDDRRVPAPPESVLLFTLRPVERLVGWIGAVPEGTRAQLLVTCPMWVNDSSFLHDVRSFVVPVSTDGRVIFDGIPDDVGVSQLTLVPGSGDTSSLLMLPATGGRALPLEVPSVTSPAQLPVCELKLQVMDAQRGPASGLILALAPKAGLGLHTRDVVSLLPLDSAGRATVRLLPGTWNMIAMAAGGWAATSLDCSPGVRTELLTLQPFETMQVRLVDASGSPMAGALPSFRGVKNLQLDESEAASPWWRVRLGRLRDRWSQLRTDTDGRAAIPLLPGVTIRIRLVLGDRRSEDFTLQANDAPLELRLP